jgi:hypothetical protein
LLRGAPPLRHISQQELDDGSDATTMAVYHRESTRGMQLTSDYLFALSAVASPPFLPGLCCLPFSLAVASLNNYKVIYDKHTEDDFFPFDFCHVSLVGNF